MQHSPKCGWPFSGSSPVELRPDAAQYKASGWTKKRLLKRAVWFSSTEEILYRKKMGFFRSSGLWLRTDLSSAMKTSVSGELKRIFILNSSEVESIMAAHLSGEANYENKVVGAD